MLSSWALRGLLSFRALCLAAAAVFFAFAAVFFFVPDPRLRIVFSDVTFPVINLASAVALFLAGRSVMQAAGVDPKQRRSARWATAAWMVMGLAQFLYVLGDAIWMALEVFLNVDPFPSPADIPYLLYYPVFLLGILLFPIRPTSHGERVKRGLDMMVVMIGAALGFWRFLISPITIASGGESPLALALALAYPVGDFLLFFAVLVLLYDRPLAKTSIAFLLLALSLVCTIITNCLFAFADLTGGEISGGMLDLGFLAGYLLVGLAALWQIHLPKQDREAALIPVRAVSQPTRPEQMLLPIVMSFFAFMLLLDSSAQPLVGGRLLMAAGVAVMILLIFLRQVAAIHENNQLLFNLNDALDTVRQQAETLEQTNRELQTEIAERVRVEEQLLYEALHDPLTDLPNRTMFLNRLEQSIARARESKDYHFSVLFLDFDQFKMINDSLGHSTGDQLLVEIARRLRASLFSSDVIARLGGDEFVVLLEDTSDEHSVIVPMAKIQDALREPYMLKGRHVYISASIGVVADAAGYRYSGDILRDADIAMYRAKEKGKDRFEVFNDHLRAQVVSRLALESELRASLAREDFTLYYQPIYKLNSGEPPRLCGFEALSRWNHPSRGLLTPDAFISAAEETGLIVNLDRWVLRTACAQMRQWGEQFAAARGLNINVNISGKQFSQPDFLPYVEETLRLSGLPAGLLGMEITERMLVDQQNNVNDAFQRLRALGVQLQIDDFGTGYSSLSYLQLFPVQTIKIDRSFVSELGSQGRGTDLIHTIILMAQRLGMHTVAEGIETSEQLHQLTAMGCECGQGYLFARPMEARAVEALLRACQSNSSSVEAVR